MLTALLCLCALVPLVPSERGSPQQQAEEPVPTICVANLCYSLQREYRRFNMARKICKGDGGDAMTVRSTVAAEAISVLLQGVGERAEHGNFWLGLQLHQKACTTNASRLKGFHWVDGDAESDYSNWGTVLPSCGPRCATVSGRDESWADRPCNERADGVLCEFRYNGSCEALSAGNGSLTYRTPFGGQSSELSELPPGTRATLHPSGPSFECTAVGNASWAWLSRSPAPWDCRLQQGGCDQECVSDGGPRCGCFPGYQLDPNKRSCSPLDPCQEWHCQHRCLVQAGSPFCMCRDGYRLDADGKSCQDLDECEQQPCDQRCSNTPGSFSCHCHPGYQMTAEGKCTDINECAQQRRPCTHHCGNTPGSFRCTCYSGYQADPTDQTVCIFYCEARTNPCQARCAGDNCECPVGYIYDDLKEQCFDYDECASNECEQLCANTFGSFKCDCHAGYELQRDGLSCEMEGSGDPQTPDTATPTPTPRPTPPPEHPATASLSLGAVLGSIFAIAVVILIVAGLGHHLLKKRGKWQTSTKYKSANLEQDVNLSQVTSAADHKQQCQYPEDKSNVET